jgi:hypothetical protein
LRELVLEARFGEIAPRGDTPALTRALEAMLAEPSRADELGARGRAHAAAHWTPTEPVTKTREIFARAIAARRGGPYTPRSS